MFLGVDGRFISAEQRRPDSRRLEKSTNRCVDLLVRQFAIDFIGSPPRAAMIRCIVCMVRLS